MPLGAIEKLAVGRSQGLQGGRGRQVPTWALQTLLDASWAGFSLGPKGKGQKERVPPGSLACLGSSLVEILAEKAERLPA